MKQNLLLILSFVVLAVSVGISVFLWQEGNRRVNYWGNDYSSNGIWLSTQNRHLAELDKFEQHSGVLGSYGQNDETKNYQITLLSTIGLPNKTLALPKLLDFNNIYEVVVNEATSRKLTPEDPYFGTLFSKVLSPTNAVIVNFIIKDINSEKFDYISSIYTWKIP